MNAKWSLVRLQYVSQAACQMTFANGSDERVFAFEISGPPISIVSCTKEFIAFVGPAAVVDWERLVGAFWTACQETISVESED